MQNRQTIESHSSYLTNKRLQMLMYMIDTLGPAASNSLLPHDIMAYYNAIEQVYINTTELLEEDDFNKCEGLRTRYNKILAIMDEYPQTQNTRTSRLLLSTTKEFNHTLISGLQRREYFFRMATKQPKGLKNMNFFSQSIFGGGKIEDTESETGGEIPGSED